MTWALFVNGKGLPEVDLYCFARLGRLISEHPTKPEADEALKQYRDRAAAVVGAAGGGG